MPGITLKRDGYALPIKTFTSTDGKSTYVVFRQDNGSYHAFVEVEAKDAAFHCGSKLGPNDNTRSHWEALWNES